MLVIDSCDETEYDVSWALDKTEWFLNTLYHKLDTLRSTKLNCENLEVIEEVNSIASNLIVIQKMLEWMQDRYGNHVDFAIYQILKSIKKNHTRAINFVDTYISYKKIFDAKINSIMNHNEGNVAYIDFQKHCKSYADKVWDLLENYY